MAVDQDPVPVAGRKRKLNDRSATRPVVTDDAASKLQGTQDQPILLDDADDDQPDVLSQPAKKRASKGRAKPASAQQPATKATAKAKKGKGKQSDHVDAPAKKSNKAKNKSNEEKRLRKFRSNPPISFIEIKDRALTQRMFVIDRTRGGTDDCPEESIEIAGTTGNIYTVNIDQAPNCTCPHAKKGNQCKHIVYVLIRVLKAPENLQYQLSFLRSELRDIFSKAPPIPSDSGDGNNDGNRKPIEDDCPICCMEFEPSKEKIVYCKAACGNNVHEHCFEQWAATKKGSGPVTCPFCRTPWAGDEASLKKIAKTGGTVNAEGYVNVANELGISGERADYSSYHDFWVRQQARDGLIGHEWRDFGREF
ncbi:uncharacterized protein K452DRAFT_270370 [Aplosporella prunicola CBS 121167]|uniref:SWIM-type domain-containing protein n=1 Tax=Aplosporella prunicola CBS 121167 TaxID=1176127 RepID=A0A6A6BGZ8_9PEZI|nr:uncharacterized protein K452DRAFT_270370 [Aplosporella prunicola CBS 121167]KAF2142595.1 hypothetical protein K452DRAFT_270370 [Aplosporella prunicola CBS 121167]